MNVTIPRLRRTRPFWATLLLSSTLSNPALAQIVTFGPPTHYAVGAQPQVVAVGDFNGDGVEDLATANRGSGNVSVMLGNGDGTFQAAVNFPAGSGPTSVSVGDFNGDGLQDLATTDYESHTVSVLLGLGDGTFNVRLSFAAGGTNPNFAAVGEFNGDGNRDLAVAIFGGGTADATTVSVLLGNGNGAFLPAQPYTVDRGPLWVAVGDFNGDGVQDLVSANFSADTASLLLGNGNGTFQSPRNFPAGSGADAVAVGEFNGDGNQDLAVADYFGNTVTELFGDGHGSFQTAATPNVVGSYPVALIVTELNGDGLEDLAVANWDRNAGTTFSVLVGSENGIFQPAQYFTAGVGVVFVAASDFDRDGAQDAAVANFNSGTVSVLLNTTAQSPPSSHVLTVTKTGTGSGTVTSSPAGIDCGADCSESYDGGTQVTLTAAADSGSVFSGWSGGGCSGTGACTVTMNAATTVTATFSQQAQSHVLTVGKTGTGSGTVTSSPSGIDCGATCSASFDDGTQVTLTVAPDSGSVFSGWSGGGCSGTGACTVIMNTALSVTANFTRQTHVLTVNKTGTGSGTVTSSPAGINCGADCSESYNSGTQVTLTAAPAGGSIFSGWSGGGCSGTGACSVTMNAAKSVTATFTLQNFTLTVAKQGLGLGTVTSSPAGIDCGLQCSASYGSGTVVTLTAAAALGSSFAGWSGGGCTGTGTCTVTMDGAKSVTATFDLQIFTLDVLKEGLGVGVVTSSSGEIDCGSKCSASLKSGTSVTLTASPGPLCAFDGWTGGGCSGTGPCTITIGANVKVKARFRLLGIL